MNKDQILAFAKKAAKSMKAEKDFSDFSRMLKKSPLRQLLALSWTTTLGMTEISRRLDQIAVTITPQKHFIPTMGLSILKFHMIEIVHSNLSL